jgi:hypothetical protein
MANFSMTDAATLFKGLDTEKWSIRPESIYFNRLDDALRHAIEKLTSNERYGAYIRLEKDQSKIEWPEIQKLYEGLA